MTTYQLKNMNPDGIKNTISKKIKDEKDMVRRLGNKDFKVARISLPIDKVYYNLLNRRTNGNIKDYCKKKNADKNSHYRSRTIGNQRHPQGCPSSWWVLKV